MATFFSLSTAGENEPKVDPDITPEANAMVESESELEVNLKEIDLSMMLAVLRLSTLETWTEGSATAVCTTLSPLS